MQLGTSELPSISERERLIMSNIAFMCAVQLSGTGFQMKLKRTYYLSININSKRKIKEKVFEFEEELSFFKT